MNVTVGEGADKCQIPAPRWLRIEISEKCNLHCPMCTSKRSDRFMDKGLFRKILSELSQWCPGALISLSVAGEPLTHPHFDDLLDIIESFENLSGFHFSTNANLLNRERLDRIIESGRFFWIIYSVDAVTNKTYSKVRKGGNLQKVEENIVYHAEKKAAVENAYIKNNASDMNNDGSSKVPTPDLQIQFIVMEENEAESLDFARKWAESLEKIGIPFTLNRWEEGKSIILFTQEIEEAPDKSFEVKQRYERIVAQIEKSFPLLNSETVPVYKQYENCGEETDKNKDGAVNVVFEATKSGISMPDFDNNSTFPPCAEPWETLCIETDGKISLCCSGDRAGQITVGRFPHQTLKEIWEGEAAKRFRMAHVKGKRKIMPRCRVCNGFRDASELDQNRKENFESLHEKSESLFSGELNTNSSFNADKEELIFWLPRAPLIVKERLEDLIASSDFESALVLVNPLIEMEPVPENWRLKGYILQQLKKNEDALEAHEKAIEMDRQYWPSLIQKGFILIEMNRFSDAEIYFEQLKNRINNNFLLESDNSNDKSSLAEQKVFERLHNEISEGLTKARSGLEWQSSNLNDRLNK